MKKALAVLIIAILVVVSILFALGEVEVYMYAIFLIAGYLYVKFVQPKL